jgi:hypothetical protein
MSMKDSDVVTDIVDQVIDMNVKKYPSTFLPRNLSCVVFDPFYDTFLTYT